MGTMSFGRAVATSRFGTTAFRGGSPPLADPTLPPLSVRPISSPPPPRPPRRLPLPRLRLVRTFALAGLALAGVGLGGSWIARDAAYGGFNAQGNAAYERGDWAGAVADYTRMVSLDPHRQDGYSLRAMALYKMDLYRLSAADDRAALARTADTESRAILFQNLGYSEGYSGDHAQAIRDFTQAIALDPSIPDRPGWTADAHDDTGDSHKGRMWAYYESRQYPLALADCQALIARDPYPTSIAVRGKIYRKMGRYGLALADFRTALREDPRALFADDQLEGLLGETRQYAAAASVAQAAARANPGNALLWWQVGWWQYRAGRMAQAVAADQKALTMNPSLAAVRYNLALAYASQGDWGKGRPLFAQALRQGTVQERHGAMVDVLTALAEQPHSAALRQALVLLHRMPGPGKA